MAIADVPKSGIATVASKVSRSPGRAIIVADDGPVSDRISAALTLWAPTRIVTRFRFDQLAKLPSNQRADDLVVGFGPRRQLGRSTLAALRAVVRGGSLVLVVPSTAGSLLRSALDAGVDGLILEEELEVALAATADAVMVGQVVVPRAALRAANPPALSPREKQVLGLVVMRFTNAEIATQLFLAESTIKTHLSSAFDKLGVRSRSEATALILDPETGFGAGILTIPGADQGPTREELVA